MCRPRVDSLVHREQGLGLATSAQSLFSSFDSTILLSESLILSLVLVPIKVSILQGSLFTTTLEIDKLVMTRWI
jgi:hypothetical protein